MTRSHKRVNFFLRLVGCNSWRQLFTTLAAAAVTAGLAAALIVSTDTGQHFLNAGRNFFNPLVEGAVGAAHQYSAAGTATEAKFFALSVSPEGSKEDVARGYREEISTGGAEVSADTKLSEWPSAVISYSNAVSAISQLTDVDVTFSDVEGFALVKADTEGHGERNSFGGVITGVEGQSALEGMEDYELANIFRGAVESRGSALIDVQTETGVLKEVRAVTDPFTGVGSMSYVNLVEEFETAIRVREGSTGTSSGLIYALTMLDTVNGGTGIDIKVAGTGAITFDGDVLSIGGLSSKLLAADFTGADVTFIPASQPEVADGLIDFDVYNTRIVPVDTLAEAASVLCEEFSMETMCV